IILSKKIKQFFKVFLFLLITLAFLNYFFPEVTENLTKRLDETSSIQEESRFRIWKEYTQHLSNYFILGEVTGDYKKFSSTDQGPHSVIFKWLTHYGILGLIGFVLLVFGTIKSIY